MNRILPIQNPIMNYEWGSRIHIAKLLGRATPSDKPQAELWMGAHPKAPSRVGDKSLKDLISEDPIGMLGAPTAKRFSKRLPFLFKLLAAGTPLSIQTHPNLDQAKIGFDSEEAAGIPLDAPNRNYKDDNHKPEILCALTDFWALNGFRQIPEMLDLLDHAELRTISSEVRIFHQNRNREGLREFFRSIIELNDVRRESLLRELVAGARNMREIKPEYTWIIRIADLYPGDIGVLCVLLLNLIKLEPGQAMYCAAGDLHAYLDGFGVELMANSDNVLRGGLTPKHVNRPELMKTLTFQDRDVEILLPTNGQYRTPSDEFVLSVLQVDGTAVSSSRLGFEILVNVGGSAKIYRFEESEAVPLPQGAAVAVPAAVTDYVVEGRARLFRASVQTA